MEPVDRKSAPIVVGLGEVLWDCFPDGRRPGGAPANVAFHASGLGLRGVVCSRVGQDEMGDALLSYLGDHGLSVDHIQRDDERPTGTVTVHAGRADSPSYTIHEDVAWDFLEFDDAVAALFRSASAVCFGTLAQRTETNRRTIGRCLGAAQDALIVYDVNLRPPHLALEWIEESLLRADVAKLNEDEAARLCLMFGVKETTPRAFAETAIQRWDVSTVAVTLGADGCVLFSPDEEARVIGRPVEVADTVGAGDAFSAGILYGLLNHWPLDRAGRFANALAGLVAARPGAMPDLRREIENLKASDARDAE